LLHRIAEFDAVVLAMLAKRCQHYLLTVVIGLVSKVWVSYVVKGIEESSPFPLVEVVLCSEE